MGISGERSWQVRAVTAALIGAFVLSGLLTTENSTAGAQDEPVLACVGPHFVQQGTTCFVTSPVGEDAGCTVTNNQPTCPEPGTIPTTATPTPLCGYSDAIAGQCPTNAPAADCLPPNFISDPTGRCFLTQAGLDQGCSINAGVPRCGFTIDTCGYASAIAGQCPTPVALPDAPAPTDPVDPPPPFAETSGPLTVATHSSIAMVWEPTTVSMTGCVGGSATFAVLDSQGAVAASGQLLEDPDGTYSTTFTGLLSSGDYTIQTAITCANASVETESIAITYYDPSGQVRDCVGTPIEGATATLLRADTATGPFTIVPNGSTLMSPKNRLNPMPTDLNGLYGWDVANGFYVVAIDAGEFGTQQTEPLEVPPPRFNVNFDFTCLLMTTIRDLVDQQPALTRPTRTILVSPQATPTASPLVEAAEATTTSSSTDEPGLAVTGSSNDLWLVGIALIGMGISTTAAARHRRQQN